MARGTGTVKGWLPYWWFSIQSLTLLLVCLVLGADTLPLAIASSNSCFTPCNALCC